jgi:hypothetical protein
MVRKYVGDAARFNTIGFGSLAARGGAPSA